MPTRRDYYLDALDEAARDRSVSLEQLFKDLFTDVDLRLTDQEGRILEIEAIKQQALAAVLAYNAEKLEPEFDRIRDLADLGLLFEGTSKTELELSAGQKTLIVAEADRARFTPAGYVQLMRNGDPAHAMAGARAEYDRSSGQLVVNIDRVVGDGVFDDWVILAVSATDFAAAASEAEAHKLGAEVFKTEAESARDTARDYRDEANTHKADAEIARTHAQGAQAQAEGARDMAAAHLAGVQALAYRYLGPQVTNPSAMPDGSALLVGALYWNIAVGEMRVYSGSAWVVAYVPSGSAVASFNGRTGGVTPQSGDYSAGQITVTPTGGIAATTVQAALAELDTEKAAAGHVHTASAITATPAGGLAAATVQAALEELDTEKAPKADPDFSGTVRASGGLLEISGAAGTNRAIRFLTGALRRFSLAVNSETEAGANSGSNLSLNRFADDGVTSVPVASINRATGKFTLEPANAASAKFNLPEGTAPTTPANGDIWNTSAGLFVRLNGATYQVSFSGHTHAVATTGASGFMSNLDKAKLDGVQDGATAYVHPAGDGNLHVPATGTGNSGKFLKAGSTAGSISWVQVTYGDLGSIPAAIAALAGLTPASDRIALYNGASTATLATVTAFARTLLDDADAATARVTLGAADAGHGHAIAGITGLQTALDGKAPLAAPLLDQPRFTRPYNVSSTDLNNLKTAGIYDGDNLTNAPAAGWWHVVVHRHSGNDLWVVQWAFALTVAAADASYMRSCLNGAWGAWTRMASTADLTGFAVASHTHDDRYYTEAEVNSALAGKAATVHGHAISDVTGLQAALNDTIRLSLGVTDIGQYAFLKRGAGTTNVDAGGLIAGSNLIWTNSVEGGTTVVNVGTWRCLGFVGGTQGTLWQRVA